MHIDTHLWKYIQYTGAEQLHFMFQVLLLTKDVLGSSTNLVTIAGLGPN